MDIYTVARMIRTFSDGHRPQHIIQYAGKAHITQSKDILERLGFIKIKEVESFTRGANYQCLDISGFEQPFFRKIRT